MYVEGGFGVDRGKVGRMDSVTMALGSRGMTVEAARKIGKMKSPGPYVDC